MPRAPTLADITDHHARSLALEAITLDRDNIRALPAESATGGRTPLIGHLNVVQPNRIQVLGPAEMDWWAGRDAADRRGLLRQLFTDALYGVIITDNQPVPEDLAGAARETGPPLLHSAYPCEQVISTLRHFLSRELAARVIIHGVFLDVLGTGVLLTGDPAVGKSELALELISRGHSLVADDAPEFSRPTPDAVYGESTPVLTDFLEVRGLGVLNIRAMYGDAAIRQRERLQLIIHLELLNEALRSQVDRLNGNLGSSDVLGLKIPSMTLPVAPGRNLAVMVEAGVRSFLLLRRGYSAAEELMQRQNGAIADDQARDAES